MLNSFSSKTVLATFATALFVLVFRALVEYYYPSYSGLSFWNPLTMVSVFLCISAIMYFFVLIVIRIFSLDISNSNQQVVLGIILGLTPLCAVISEKLCLIVIFCSALIWCFMGARNNA